MRQGCTLVLSDGNRFKGELIGAPLKTSGELVFTTGMVGYSEAITDPSYFGQILCFTYPLIGNYGIPPLPLDRHTPPPKGFESWRPWAAGVILTVDCAETFHWNSFQSLDTWMEQQNIPGIAGIDTRHLVHLIRNTSNLLGRLEPDEPKGSLKFGETDLANDAMFFDPGGRDILGYVSGSERRVLGKGKHRIAVVDCGVKWNIIRQLLDFGCEVELIPWNTPLATVDCSAWLLSNGPGDPTRTGNLRDEVRKLLQRDQPILGICLGHQILSLAAGAVTKRMPYGHRSHNQPVYEVGKRFGYITSQNHGYVVEDASLPDGWSAWFRNVNDQTIEGIKHESKPFRSVQFHPEASGGPRDTSWILEQFVAEVTK